MFVKLLKYFCRINRFDNYFICRDFLSTNTDNFQKRKLIFKPGYLECSSMCWLYFFLQFPVGQDGEH